MLTLMTDMFRTLRNSTLPEGHRFATTVGAKTKQTLATWHLLEPADVIAAIAMLNGATDAVDVAGVVDNTYSPASPSAPKPSTSFEPVPTLAPSSTKKGS